MKRRPIAAVLAVTLAGMHALPVAAAPTPGAPDAPDHGSHATSTQSSKDPNIPTAPAPVESPENARTDKQTSPYDYRPSEEISEDLSVSFPVDI